MSSFIVGVDVGNYDTKTQNTTITSGFKEYSIKPLIASKILEYDGRFYVPDIDCRFPYKVDKTETNQCIILTLFGIAEEMIYQATKDSEHKDREEIQKIILSYEDVKLGAGLPPGHFNSAEKLSNYYYQVMGDGIEFTYCKYKFKFKVSKVAILPQDFIAVYDNPEVSIPKMNFPKYVIIGIGGGTVDIMPVIFDKNAKKYLPNVNECISKEAGTRIMYGNILGVLQRHMGDMYSEADVEAVLLGMPSLLSSEAKRIIENTARDHVREIFTECESLGLKIKSTPIIFYGGGVALLKKFIVMEEDMSEKDGKEQGRFELFTDINANAKMYAKTVGRYNS